jgi:Ca2+-binding EF-hand superfamily protein
MPGAVRAQAPEPPNQILMSRLVGGETLDRFLQNMRRDFANMDADHNGVVDASDVELHNVVSAATLRMGVVMRTFMFDLDGDGAVTADEVRRKLRYDMRMQNNQGFGRQTQAERIEQQVRAIMAADADHDGRITWNEAYEHAKKQPQYAQLERFGPAHSARQMIALAPAGKTSITLAELEAAATAFFRSVDTDGNGTISLEEHEAMRRQANKAASEAARLRVPTDLKARCEMPKASAAAKVVLLSAYETQALSNVALGTQDDVTGVGDVTVEPGEGPLYIVIVTYRPTIWRFSGAVERVERAVLISNRYISALAKSDVKQASGAIGLPAERVSFQPRHNCLNQFAEVPSTASAQASGLVLAAAGKGVDVAAASYAVTGFSVPSGKIERVGEDRSTIVTIQKRGVTLEIEGGGDRTIRVLGANNLERELHRFNPGGVINVDAKQVVASAPAEPYEVLPQQAGLLQLMKSGALTRNRSGEYLINQKIRIPAGLAGAHSVKFLLRRGVPEPVGDAGHSKIISEETGQVVTPRKD